MRISRAIVAIGSLLAMLAIPGVARANGGAYIEFTRTYSLAGDRLVGEAYVSVPPAKERLFDGGPFYAFLLPRGASIAEGRPIPPDAVRAGTFSIDAGTQGSFELRVAFTVPAIEPGTYGVGLCNDPCTISGFREPLTGQISVVATPREAQLYVERDHLRSRLSGLRRQLRKADRALDTLRAQAAATAEDAAVAETEVASTAAELQDARSTISDLRAEGRTLITPWGVVAIVGGLLLIAVVVAVRRRTARPVPAARAT